jgi:phosphatidylglycerol lysyltransferase
VALACGDLLTSDNTMKHAIEEFMQFCQHNGWTPCVYEAAQDHLHLYREMGFRALKIAEEALLDLREFSLAGNRRHNLRAMVNKVAKTGMAVQRYDRAKDPDPQKDEQLEAISQEWLAEKRLGELGFTLGRFSLEALESVPVFLATNRERVEAFCSWLPYRNGHAVVLDLMRKRKQAASGTMDILLAQSLLQLRAEGFEEASLANAPLANVGEPHTTLDRGVLLLFENLNSFYGYKNLFQFKKKFAPCWQGRYLIYPQDADLPAVVYALTRLHTEGGLWQLVFGR